MDFSWKFNTNLYGYFINMSDTNKPQPNNNKPVEPVKPSENPGTPIQKGPTPVEPVKPSYSPGTRLPFNEPENNTTIKANE